MFSFRIHMDERSQDMRLLTWLRRSQKRKAPAQQFWLVHIKPISGKPASCNSPEVISPRSTQRLRSNVCLERGRQLRNSRQRKHVSATPYSFGTGSLCWCNGRAGAVRRGGRAEGSGSQLQVTEGRRGLELSARPASQTRHLGQNQIHSTPQKL